MKTLLQIFVLFFFIFPLYSQDSSNILKKITVSGYIKDLQTLTFDKNFKNLVSGNLIHNRFNIKWKPSEKITMAAEFRNRLFWGEEVKQTPGFSSQLKNENEKVNLQVIWIDNGSVVLHTNTERLFFDYRDEKINFRVGRQRINWGLSTTWNPNDIFNSYNFLDFDYEERPGVDGGKIQYIFNNSSNTEFAWAYNGDQNKSVAGIKYSFNKLNYDVQLITGWYNEHLTLGSGWAGYIKNAGFKGELQYFVRDKDSADHLNLSLETDYMFKRGWYTSLGFLFNSRGLYQPVNDWDNINLKISPENLMPTKWNFIVTTAKEFTPLLSGNLSVLYAPGTNLLILYPSIQYNIATNFDVSLVWQSFFSDIGNQFEAINHQCFLRFKWSF